MQKRNSRDEPWTRGTIHCCLRSRVRRERGGHVYFCRSMCCEMEMPGHWTMSMMWMRMRGQTWGGIGVSFLLMWLQ